MDEVTIRKDDLRLLLDAATSNPYCGDDDPEVWSAISRAEKILEEN